MQPTTKTTKQDYRYFYLYDRLIQNKTEGFYFKSIGELNRFTFNQN